MLREQHKTGAPPDALRALCGDPVVVVRASARDHWVALGGAVWRGAGVNFGPSAVSISHCPSNKAQGVS